MSTFYATFRNVRSAQSAVHELLRGGVNPDSVSVIANDANVGAEHRSERGSEAHMREEVHSVGDATSFVGRKDDPRRDEIPPSPEDFTKFSTSVLNDSTMGIDTSNISNDVESIDQNDDSQEQAERSTYPAGLVSQSEHERDDINLALHTGYPTPIPVIEDQVIDTETPLQDQNDDSLDTIVVPGFGMVMGGGALATAALDFLNPNGKHETDSLVNHLRDEGVPGDRAEALRDAFESGSAVVAVEIVPGETNEEQVEATSERHGAENAGLFDAPRFYQNGGRMPKSGGKDS
ncbi:MAG: hypothetical protein ACO1SV_23070 [Fimbriimonas sp.]